MKSILLINVKCKTNFSAGLIQYLLVLLSWQHFSFMSNQSFMLSRVEYKKSFITAESGLEVIKLEYSLKLKIKRNDWLLADTCLQAANQCALF